MRRILAILKPLPVPARRRVLGYATERIETEEKAAQAARYPDGAIARGPVNVPLQGAQQQLAGSFDPLFHQAAVAAGGLLG